MSEILCLTIQLVIMAIAFLLGKYFVPSVPQETLATLSAWAGNLVVWAREFLASKTGSEKMSAVTAQLADIAKKNKISVTEEQLKAVAQKAYEAMKAGEANAEQS